MDTHAIAIFTLALTTASGLVFGAGKVLNNLRERIRCTYEMIRISQQQGYLDSLEILRLFTVLFSIEECNRKAQSLSRLMLICCISSYLFGINGFVLIVFYEFTQFTINLSKLIYGIELLAIVAIFSNLVIALLIRSGNQHVIDTINTISTSKNSIES